MTRKFTVVVIVLRSRPNLTGVTTLGALLGQQAVARGYLRQACSSHSVGQSTRHFRCNGPSAGGAAVSMTISPV
jgi:hypothetical protein